MNSYYTMHDYTLSELQNNVHRMNVGDIWDEQGDLQLNVCKKYGLTPNMKLLDFGCGCLRGGVKFVDFLDKGNYYGVDVNGALVRAGLEHEIPKVELQHKTVQSNFLITDRFEIEYFKVHFDMILAQSVFTHLPLNHYDFFLHKCSEVLKCNGKVLATFWLIDEQQDVTKDNLVMSKDFQMRTSYIFDSYHYKFSTLKKIVEDRWNITILDDRHPRNQKFLMFTKK